jgi:5-methylcytosine-specific restriction endonuclease McrA
MKEQQLKDIADLRNVTDKAKEALVAYLTCEDFDKWVVEQYGAKDSKEYLNLLARLRTVKILNENNEYQPDRVAALAKKYRKRASRKAKRLSKPKPVKVKKPKQDMDPVVIQIKTYLAFTKRNYKDPFFHNPEWAKLRLQILDRDGKRCAKCGRTGTLHIDHILPRSKFPEREMDPTNLQVLCRDCNLEKGTKIQ